MDKKLKLAPDQLRPLIESTLMCSATDKIMVEGSPVRLMYRDEPLNDTDSGWVLLSGEEDEEYVDNPEHWGVYPLNTLANYDEAIISYMELPVETELERSFGEDHFEIIS